MVMVVFVVLDLLHPLSQSLQLLLQAVDPVHPVAINHLPLALLHCDSVVWLNLIVTLVMKQDLKC